MVINHLLIGMILQVDPKWALRDDLIFWVQGDVASTFATWKSVKGLPWMSQGSVGL